MFTDRRYFVSLFAHRFGWVSLLLAVSGMVTGCQKNQPPLTVPPVSAQALTTAPPSSTAPQPLEYKAAVTSNAYFELRRLAGEVQTTEEAALAAWRELLPRMAKDEKTRELLRHLHGDLPVDISVVETAQAKDTGLMMAVPPEGVAVAVRLADNILDQTNLGGGRSVPARSMTYGHVVLIKNAASSAGGEFGALGPPNGMPAPFEPIKLAMEDYFHRHAPGWILNNGGYSAKDAKLPASSEEHRRDLDARIKAYADYAKTFYDVRRPLP
ncbi:hypothetical protein ETAA8_07050 [Anatilimnocola aggregata]|uniref:Uncharacterized protein n=1 Tax=Anatilimnocola aggregata TaxID=2528021 RepID=A0A517Y5X6_9BACT|nr:hypothetical protein [Anatilimnocola aggregata]QDU25635.1 hypothetical protein ETAA8_07050 [Anatilimnocola aggregata]